MLIGKNIVEKFLPFIGFIALFLIIGAINHDFWAPMNILNLLRQISINALIAFGMTFVILTGGIDLSVGAILALSGAFMASFIVHGCDPILAIILATLIGAILGAVNGLLVTKGKIAPFIATLATMTIYRGSTMVYTDGNPITGLSDSFWFQVFGRGYMFGLPVPAITVIITFVFAWLVLSKTPFGRHIYAIGGNEKASLISGVKVNKIKVMVYAINGLLAALAGSIVVSRLNSAQPTAGTSYELDAIAAVVLGGTSLTGGHGKVIGTLVGALIIGTLNNGLNILGVSSFYQLIVKGAVILLAVFIDRRKVA